MSSPQYGKINRSQALVRYHLDHLGVSCSELARIFNVSIQRVNYLVKTNDRKEWILRNDRLQSNDDF